MTPTKSIERKELEQYKCVGMTCNHERSDEHYVLGDEDLKSILSHSVQEAKAEELDRIINILNREVDVAKQDVEMADDQSDPKVRLNYFIDLLASLKQEEEV